MRQNLYDWKALKPLGTMARTSTVGADLNDGRWVFWFLTLVTQMFSRGLPVCARSHDGQPEPLAKVKVFNESY
jgi:hypothetical protein